jgi:CRP-like cAMP-binding protein
MKRNTSAKRKPGFNPLTFLSTIGKGRALLPFQKKDKIFTQGDSRDGLFFVQTGKVRLSVVSEAGKEATLGVLAKAISLEKVGLPVSHIACRLPPQ